MRISPRYRSLAQTTPFWQGEASLHGRRWLVGALEYPNARELNAGQRFWLFLLQAADSSAEGEVEPAWTFPPTQHLFVDDHAYRLEWSSAGNGEGATLKMAFTSENPALGELKLDGAGLRRLQLCGRYAALLRPADRVLRLPVDTYSQSEITLEGTNNSSRYFASLGQQIRISTTNTSVLRAGGPLTNQVTVSLRGRSLLLDYRLIAADGRSYQSEDQSQPPRFTVYRDGQTVGSGTFQYG